ncbi:MAG TPA: hypothetical protein DEO86_20640 [Colwellia sp.]|nr:hypothetical protein [Colwellia sp.]
MGIKMALDKGNTLSIVILWFQYLTQSTVILNPPKKRLSNITSSQRLELKLLKHSETCILNDNGYI